MQLLQWLSCLKAGNTPHAVFLTGPAGSGKKEAVDMPVTKDIEEVISSRMSYFKQFPGEKSIFTHTGAPVAAVGITPVINGGDCAGAVALLSDSGRVLTDSQKKLLVLTATLLASNLES